MVTDAAGLRWVATDDGVYRYDGNEIVPLKSLVLQGPRVAVEAVSSLAFDRAGRLWMGTQSGLACFDPVTGQLRAVPLPLGPDESPKVSALLYHPRTNHLWVGYGAGGIAVVDALHPQAPYFPAHRVLETAFYFTAETGGDGVWLASDQPALYHLAPTGAVRRQFRVSGLLLPVARTRPQRFFGRQGMLVLDAADRLQTICRWPQELPQLTYAPYATDSTLDAVAQGQWWHVADVRGAHPRLSATPLPGAPLQARTRCCRRMVALRPRLARLLQAAAGAAGGGTRASGRRSSGWQRPAHYPAARRAAFRVHLQRLLHPGGRLAQSPAAALPPQRIRRQGIV